MVIIIMCIPAFFFFVFVCIWRLIHDTDQCVNTDITGGSIKEGGWDGPTRRTLLNCVFKVTAYLPGSCSATDVLRTGHCKMIKASVLWKRYGYWLSLLFFVDHTDTSCDEQFFFSLCGASGGGGMCVCNFTFFCLSIFLKYLENVRLYLSLRLWENTFLKKEACAKIQQAIRPQKDLLIMVKRCKLK